MFKAKEINTVKNKHCNLYITVFCLGLSFFLIILSRQSSSFSLWYSENIFPVFVNTLGRVFSFMPFSVFEILVYITVLWLFYSFAKIVYLIIRKPIRPKLFFKRTIFAISVLLLFFTLTAGINYGSPALLDELRNERNKLDHEKMISNKYDGCSEEELIALYHILINDVANLGNKVSRNSSGFLSLAVDHPNREEQIARLTRPAQTNNFNLSAEANQAMRNLTHRYPKLAGYYPEPKAVFFSKGMTYLGITGIYSPFTLEANYNSHIPSYLIPFTICHELAHLKGFMREEEANFIAYLACRDSSSREFQYSGAMNALSYTLSALYKTVDQKLYQKLLTEIPQVAQIEIVNNKAYWQTHKKKITDISTKANDTYLKANAQTSGIKSYGLVVELLLEEYKNEKN